MLAQRTRLRDILYRWPAGCGQDPWRCRSVVRAKYGSEQAATGKGSSCSEKFVLPWRQQACAVGER